MIRSARLALIPFLLLLLAAFPAVSRDFYWEHPTPVGPYDSRFPDSSSNGAASAIIWEEIESSGSDGGSIWLSMRIYTGLEWRQKDRFAGPFRYAGEIPSIASVTIDSRNKILVTAATAASTVSVFVSEDWGENFSRVDLPVSTPAVLAPKVFTTRNDGYLLFGTRGSEENFNLVWSHSDDGVSWSAFEPFAPAAGLSQAFLPDHVTHGNSDIIVFQALGQDKSPYQLYSTVSRDSGASWSEPTVITGFTEPGESPASAAGRSENWINQRAKLLSIGNSVSLVWERSRTTNLKYGIYLATLNEFGALIGNPERVSPADGNCFDPDIVELDGAPAILWFDNRRGANRIYFSQRQGLFWNETDLAQTNLVQTSYDAVFGRLLPTADGLEIYWQQAQRKGDQRLMRLVPDETVRKPSIAPANFIASGKGRGEAVRATVRLPEDSSGIAGYDWAWALGSEPPVGTQIKLLQNQTSLSVNADQDGTWYLGVRAADYAGNWSEPVYIAYTRDTTAPVAPIIDAPDTDEKGFGISNSLTLRWEPAEPDDIAGYSWNFEYLAPETYLSVLAAHNSSRGQTAPVAVPSSFDFESAAANRFRVSPLSRTVRTRGASTSIRNVDNGIYAISVAAIDSVGNVGPAAVRYIALNKYVPYTYITYIDSKVDETGVVSLSIIGRGFTQNGTVSSLYIDRDGIAPWDVDLTRESRRFTVSSDRVIQNIALADLEEGDYRIGLLHPVRGLYFSKPILHVDAFGTVKFGDFRYEYKPSWEISATEAKPALNPGRIVLYALMLFALMALAFSVFGIANTAADSIRIQQEVAALLTGDVMPSEKRKKSVALRSRGISLRFKLTLFTTVLVVSVTLLISIPLGLRFSSNQERTLAAGLASRVNVLLDSLSTSAKAYLPSQNVLELGFLPDQMTALAEATSATVTGNSSGSATGISFVWATNDAEIASKIDTPSLEPGKSEMQGEENDAIITRVSALEERAALAVDELSQGISSLTQEGIKLALNTDAASVQRRDEIQTITRQLEEKLNNELNRLSKEGSGSWPTYDPESLSRSVTDYVFYKPVLYRRSGDPSYVHGTVRVSISTQSLLAAVDAERNALISTTLTIALFAVAMGVLGALLLASIIISPVRRLAAHVAMIRDTEDKETLEGQDLRLRSRDEIGLLGETINEMTHGLVKAAAASKDLTVGKEVQKMFIPLETDDHGRKLTCGSSSDDHVDFFGYYEGAKGVSGDYFDYIKLDERHYALIKCDVAGKGVPAALIMVEVATLFLDYFKDWKFAKNGYKLDYIVSRINDLIESRGFKGRFAAFTLCIFDAVSGDAHFCNAGDNLVHIYDNSEKRMKVIQLPESSAAGVFPTFMVDMKGGFRVQKIHLDPGDVLFMYTDGIEEAKRLFRTKKLEVHACAEPGLAAEAPHGSHSVGQDNEELGPERVNGIIEAVLSRSPYRLDKWHDSDPDSVYEFDFTKCEGTIEEAILALVSVEKVFRMYRDPKATEFNRVQVDRKVDLFLNKYFMQYGTYCGRRKDHSDYPEYMYYTHLKEDDQYDDLTILGVRKK